VSGYSASFFQVREARVYVFKVILPIFGVFVWLRCLNEVVGRIKMYGVRVCLIDVALLFFYIAHFS